MDNNLVVTQVEAPRQDADQSVMEALSNLTDVDMSAIVKPFDLDSTPMRLVENGNNRLDIRINVQVPKWAFFNVILIDIPIHQRGKDHGVVSGLLDHLADVNGAHLWLTSHESLLHMLHVV